MLTIRGRPDCGAPPPGSPPRRPRRFPSADRRADRHGLPHARSPGRQCPNKSVGANIPFASKWASASSTVRKILVAVSVMNGLGFFFGFHTT